MGYEKGFESLGVAGQGLGAQVVFFFTSSVIGNDEGLNMMGQQINTWF